MNIVKFILISPFILYACYVYKYYFSEQALFIRSLLSVDEENRILSNEHSQMTPLQKSETKYEPKPYRNIGRMFTLKGKVTNVHENSTVNVDILYPPKNYSTTAVFRLNKADALRLNIGQKITFVGKFTGGSYMFVKFDDVKIKA